MSNVLTDPLKIITIPPYSYLPEAVVYIETDSGDCYLADLCTPIFDELLKMEDQGGNRV